MMTLNNACLMKFEINYKDFWSKNLTESVLRYPFTVKLYAGWNSDADMLIKSSIRDI